MIEIAAGKNDSIQSHMAEKYCQHFYCRVPVDLLTEVSPVRLGHLFLIVDHELKFANRPRESVFDEKFVRRPLNVFADLATVSRSIKKRPQDEHV